MPIAVKFKIKKSPEIAGDFLFFQNLIPMKSFIAGAMPRR
jgi:hypothetical protein